MRLDLSYFSSAVPSKHSSGSSLSGFIRSELPLKCAVYVQIGGIWLRLIGSLRLAQKVIVKL